jgi:Ser/Thr protein kinase RdoA (MazF antagonist)
MHLNQSQLSRIAAAYGSKHEVTIEIASGYRNTSYMFRARDGRVYNFILYKHEPGIVERIQRINRLSKHLSRTDLPVRAACDDRIMMLKTGGVTRYGCMYLWLPGATIAWEMYSMKHIKLLGMAAGLVHKAMADYADDTLPSVSQESHSICDRMEKYFASAAVAGAIKTKLGVEIPQGVFTQLRDTLTAAAGFPRSQPLHLDLVRGNVLFGAAKADSQIAVDQLAITGILDFEKTAWGPIVFDVARSVSFLYVDCDKPRHKNKKYFIDSGYCKRGGQTISPAELAQLEPLVSFYLMYDFYKFLSQNPYEALPQNHHFKRTKDILLQRQMLYYEEEK